MKRLLVLAGNHAHDLLTLGLHDRFVVLRATDRNLPEEPFDLCIVEADLLSRCSAWLLRKRRSVYPEILPVLLVALPEELDGFGDDVWKVVDDVLPAPVDKRFLRARLDVLLRMREYSLLVMERNRMLGDQNRQLMKEIEERKRAETRTRRSEQRLRSYFELPIVGFAIMDADTRFREVNEKLCQILGYSREELITMTWSSLPAPDRRDDIEFRLTQLHSGESEGWNHEIQCFKKSGSAVHVNVSTRCVRNEAGRVEYLVTVMQDVTERKMEEERRLELLKEMERFTYIVSHDLRNPLINIAGFSRELRHELNRVIEHLTHDTTGCSEPLPESVLPSLTTEVPECLAFIESSVDHMDRMVSALLNLSRTGRRQLHFEWLDMEDVLHKTVDTFAHQIQEAGARIDLKPLPSVVADRTSMEQIFSNLLGNALKYRSPGRGLVVEVAGERRGDDTLFRVTDNGAGFGTEDQERVFDIFYRTGAMQVAGEGMGLAYVKALVRRHRGRIWCQSKPRLGSVFLFTVANDFEISPE